MLWEILEQVGVIVESVCTGRGLSGKAMPILGSLLLSEKAVEVLSMFSVNDVCILSDVSSVDNVDHLRFVLFRIYVLHCISALLRACGTCVPERMHTCILSV